MRRLWLLVLLALVWGTPAFAQSTTVSGTITDTGSQAWFGGTIQFRFRPADSNPTAQYIWNGAPFSSSSTFPASPLQLNGSGAFSGLSIPSNTSIAPANSTWTVTVCPAATVANCYTKNLTITGGTQDISSQVIPPAVVVNLSVPLIGALAYTDNEVQGAPPGTDYFNVTDNRLHVCLFSGFPPCSWFVLNGGAGTVTSVSDLSPLFTTSNPTTTPTFALISQSQNLFYASPNGSSGVPSFRALVSADLPAGTGTVTGVTASAPLTSSGGTAPNIACPTCVTSVSGTANQITSSGGTTPTLSIPTTFVAPGTLRATTSITDSGLTASRCVQTTTGGLLTVASGLCGTDTGSTQTEALLITSGICTNTSSAESKCSMGPFTWPTAFADSNYAITCSTTNPTSTSASNPGIYPIYWASKSATQFSLVMQSGSASAGGNTTVSEIDCMGVHP